MTVSEYIVKYLKIFGVKHYFGYQGTMIAYFVDAIYKEGDVYNHIAYNEQGAALAASGYAKYSGEIAVAYATSGPGAINLLQGIADAFYDSAPVLFITGQLNYSEYTDNKELRQQGFQQTNIIKICQSITKKAKMITDPNDIPYILEELINGALDGRKGPVLLDIPMDVQRAIIDDKTKAIIEKKIRVYNVVNKEEEQAAISIYEALKISKRPILLLGNGIEKNSHIRNNIKKIIENLKIPVITTMLAKDILPFNCQYNLGILGYSYGHRYANAIVNKKTDLIIAMGSRLCPRQIGNKSLEFAKEAKIIRIEIDSEEKKRSIHFDDLIFSVDVNRVIDIMAEMEFDIEFNEWSQKCIEIRRILNKIDENQDYRKPNEIVRLISKLAKEKSVIACDVGQHQLWVAQSFENRGEQRILFSGAHGAMGFALPAAIGSYYSSGMLPICIAGDGAFQMNIQELQWIKKENIPIKIVVFNNHSLGLIRQQQEGIFCKRYYGSTPLFGYASPSFTSIASAYGIKSVKYTDDDILEGNVSDEIEMILCDDTEPFLIEIEIYCDTYAYPKTEFGAEMHNQLPAVPKEIMEKIISF